MYLLSIYLHSLYVLQGTYIRTGGSAGFVWRTDAAERVEARQDCCYDYRWYSCHVGALSPLSELPKRSDRR